MADPEEIKEWLSKADEDWRVAEILLISGEELTLHHSRRSRRRGGIAKIRTERSRSAIPTPNPNQYRHQTEDGPLLSIKGTEPTASISQRPSYKPPARLPFSCIFVHFCGYLCPLPSASPFSIERSMFNARRSPVPSPLSASSPARSPSQVHGRTEMS
jgi:hypothetical protein